MVASVCFNIPDQRIILFYNGFRIDNYSLPVTLAERGIVHVIDRRNVEAAEVVVSFRPLWNSPPHRLALSGEMMVREVVESYLVPRLDLLESKFFLVYVGKVLNRANKLF
jgi:hypothetical protein